MKKAILFTCLAFAIGSMTSVASSKMEVPKTHKPGKDAPCTFSDFSGSKFIINNVDMDVLFVADEIACPSLNTSGTANDFAELKANVTELYSANCKASYYLRHADV